MNEWLQKVLDQIKKLWGKWSALQKIIFFSIIGAAVVALVLLIGFSASPSMTPLITTPVTDQELLQKISVRLDDEGVEHEVTAEGRIYVRDKTTAKRMVSLLVREDLIPQEASPWDVFKMDQWTVTDFERNVNLRQAITRSVEDHIEALEDVDAAEVSLVLPEDALFQEDQNPVTASIIITPRPNSDIRENKNKIKGIQKLIQLAVEGLLEENIVITDHQGTTLNDFAGLEDLDRLELAKREMKTKQNLEQEYKGEILKELMQIFGKDRVNVIKVDISLDMGEKTVETEEHYPIVKTEDNPQTPYSEREVIESITLSKSTLDESFEGTGFNPEGPPGQEGQTPPAYKDLEGLVGKYSRNSVTQNEVVNTRNIYEKKSPWEIERISVAVAIDGTWKWKYDDEGNVLFNPDGSIQRDYIPVDETSLTKAESLVEHAIGYNQNRGDTVTVQHLQFDRSQQFAAEDEEFRARERVKQMILYGAIGIAIILVAFIAFRLVSKEIERRRKLREEELSRQHQAMREAALRSAEEEEMDVQMSVEERARLELQENAINMAREHPEDVAQLIRTWLAEE
jgi:flagellar M-ring protein FliF